MECNLKVTYNTITIIHQDGHLYHERSKVIIHSINGIDGKGLSLALQTVQANATVIYNTINSRVVIQPQSTEKLSFLPYSYTYQGNITDFHILLRTTYTYFVSATFVCIKNLVFFDGPTFKSPIINFDCNKGTIEEITVHLKCSLFIDMTPTKNWCII